VLEPASARVTSAMASCLAVTVADSAGSTTANIDSIATTTVAATSLPRAEIVPYRPHGREDYPVSGLSGQVNEAGTVPASSFPSKALEELGVRLAPWRLRRGHRCRLLAGADGAFEGSFALAVQLKSLRLTSRR
jgi:hypothetical protein